MSLLKYTSKYFLISLLCLVVISGIFLFVSRSRDTAVDDEQIISNGEHAHGDHRGYVRRSSKPPPPGETDKTGHWDGDVWHKTPIPVQKSSRSQQSSYIHFDLDDESIALARRIIRKRPYSEDALRARLFLSEYDENGWTDKATELAREYDALAYHPESSLLLFELGISTSLNSPEEAIGYAQKALKHLPANADGAGIYGGVLAVAYQRLGDSKTAMMYLKKAQKLVRARPPRTGHIDIELNDYSYEIEALKAGTWFEPMEGLESEESSTSVSQPSVLDPASSDTEDSSDASLDRLLEDPSEDTSGSDGSDVFPAEVWDEDRAAAAIRHLAFEQRYSHDFLEHRQSHFREYQDFVEWTSSVLKASGNDAAAFMTALQHQLQARSQEAKQTKERINSDRMRRASSLLRRLGPEAGFQQLREVDPQLANRLLRSVPSKSYGAVRPQKETLK